MTTAFRGMEQKQTARHYEMARNKEHSKWLYDDSVGFVMTSDDSGDQVVAVGVVYSLSICRPSAPKTFVRKVDPRRFGYDQGTFEPMDVQ